MVISSVVGNPGVGASPAPNECNSSWIRTFAAVATSSVAILRKL